MNRRLSILYHHRTQGRHAEGVHVEGLVAAFRGAGHRVRLVAPPGVAAAGRGRGRSGAGGGSSDRLAGLWGLLSRFSPQLVFDGLSLAYNAYSYARLTGAIREETPDLIYDRYALFNAAPALVARRFGVALVSEVNDATVIERSRPLSLAPLAKSLEGFVFRSSSLLVTVSHNFRRRIAAAHGIGEAASVVLPNAVDPDRFRVPDDAELRARLGLQDKAVAGVVGAFVPWHGLEFLVASLAPMLRRHEERRILLVGDGPVRPAVERRARELGLEGRVLFTGFVPAERVPHYISCMDICLMPDSNDHGSPIKIFEYMAMGKPVVAPGYGPIREVIEDGRTGLLFAARDPDELREKLDRLFGDATLRLALGRAAREYVLAEHTWTANARSVLGRLGFD